ncbi:hypothetical protein [Flindersiella endophytica]
MTHATEIVLLGYNPGVQLVGDDGRPTAFVSIWGVDWSPKGHGQAIVAVYEGTVRVLGPDPELGGWLAEYFVRHFPDVEGLRWAAPTIEEAPVHVELDLAAGVHARAGDLEVRLGDVLARRPVSIDAFPLGADVPPHALTMALAPCANAEITVGGRRLAGHVKVSGPADRPSSTAYISHSETWRRPV